MKNLVFVLLMSAQSLSAATNDFLPGKAQIFPEPASSISSCLHSSTLILEDSPALGTIAFIKSFVSGFCVVMPEPARLYEINERSEDACGSKIYKGKIMAGAADLIAVTIVDHRLRRCDDLPGLQEVFVTEIYGDGYKSVQAGFFE